MMDESKLLERQGRLARDYCKTHRAYLRGARGRGRDGRATEDEEGWL
jgi:hypothetical protein